MARDRAKGRPLRRRNVGIRAPRKTVLVFCEGKKTEPHYLKALKGEPEVHRTSAIEIRTAPNDGLPLTLVEHAIAAQRRAQHEAAEYDEVWCVFDVEWPQNHPNLVSAVTKARRHGIQLAVSNPCFELWLVLHFQSHHAWIDTNNARRLRRQQDGVEDKGLDGSIYMPRRHDACSEPWSLMRCTDPRAPGSHMTTRRRA